MTRQQPAWTNREGADRARTAFRELTREEPTGVWASPGRVNLIGEHTDYNGGLCLPIALPHRAFVAASARKDNRVRMATVTESGALDIWEGDLADIAPGGVSGWVAYCGGTAWALREAGYTVPGFDLAIVSCVPLGAGLSSSAAVSCAVGLALAELGGHPLDGNDRDRNILAGLSVRAENEVAGAPTGGMDQAASLRTQEGHALLLDCLDQSVQHIPFDLDESGLALLVIDTRVSHSLADGQYAARRGACERAAEILGVDTLREVDDLHGALSQLPDEVTRSRVRHVVTEIGRVTEFVDAAEAGNWPLVGALMDASHRSLRDDYEVSCAELDTAVAAALAAGALGARMTGGGFGGSAIALVKQADADAVGDAVIAAAAEAEMTEPAVHLATPSAPGERLDS